jgi:hypothetical protein
MRSAFRRFPTPPLLQIEDVKSKLSLELYKDEDPFDRSVWLLFRTEKIRHKTLILVFIISHLYHQHVQACLHLLIPPMIQIEVVSEVEQCHHLINSNH